LQTKTHTTCKIPFDTKACEAIAYINIEHALFEPRANDESTARVAEKPEEIKVLQEVSFEYVCKKDSLIFLRKRK